jgi:hypothetical protein
MSNQMRPIAEQVANRFSICMIVTLLSGWVIPISVAIEEDQFKLVS